MPVRRAAFTLVLIRAGETSWEQDGRLLGRADLPLSDRGRAAVVAAGSRPWIARAGVGTVYHADDDAARETAQVVARAAGARTRAVTDLADPSLGIFEGLTLDRFAERFGKRHRQWMDDPGGLVPPEGEAIADACDRLFRTIARTLKRSRGRSTAMVLHGIGIAAARCWLADRPRSELWATDADRPPIEQYVLTRRQVDLLADPDRDRAA